MNDDSPSGTYMQEQMDQARFLACIAEPTRLQILLLLAKGKKKCVGEIADTLGKEQSLISHHLARLRKCNIISATQAAQKVYYAITDSRISELVLIVQSLVNDRPFCEKEAGYHGIVYGGAGRN
jgi:ArsR family transcriptional regulator